MHFKEYYTSLNKEGKLQLAKKLDTKPNYLSQLAHGHRSPGRKFILSIKKASGGKVSPEEMYLAKE